MSAPPPFSGIDDDATDRAYEVRALLRWPDVPDCRDWLGLDRRGVWRLRGAPIRHARTSEFLGRHYRPDTDGSWFVQNGPQRAYVTLDTAPWILALRGDGRLATHTGLAVQLPTEVIVTELADIYVTTEHGLGLLADRDIAAFADALVCARDDHADVDGLSALLRMAAAGAPACVLGWRGLALTCRHLADTALERTFGFIRDPTARQVPPPESLPPAPK